MRLDDRPGLEIATALLPDFWQVAGIVLASWHAWALFSGRQRARTWAVGGSASFWCNFTYGIVAAAIMQGRPIPITIVPCVSCWC